jgi:predicted nucleotidyltransferase
MTLLQQIDSERSLRREALRDKTRRRLRRALKDLLPGQRVIVFGSLSKPGKFSETSDVDIAIDHEPANASIYQLTSLLAEKLGRPVDVVLLGDCRLRDRILREGETWTLPG